MCFASRLSLSLSLTLSFPICKYNLIIIRVARNPISTTHTPQVHHRNVNKDFPILKKKIATDVVNVTTKKNVCTARACLLGKKTYTNP